MTKKEIEEELGINRNIVECKCLPEEDLMYLGSGINRNIVECKSELGRRFPATGAVLIETLWNVNSTYLCMIGSQIPY